MQEAGLTGWPSSCAAWVKSVQALEVTLGAAGRLQQCCPSLRDGNLCDKSSPRGEAGLRREEQQKGLFKTF